ncbi:MAG: hypothetical protein WC694_01455 [Candidatus Paceibacterota bacterium]|jgi:hypothetical protein
MKNEIKNFTRRGGKQSGFLQIIILIVLALLIMKYFGITVSGVFDWFISIFRSVLK